MTYLAGSFMAGDPLNGDGFVVLNCVEFSHDGNVRPQATPYPGSNLFSLASGGSIYVRDPFKQVDEEQLNGGEVVPMEEKDWDLILPCLQENERSKQKIFLGGDTMNLQTIDDVKKIVKEKNISFIQFWFTDVLGMLKSFAITPSELEEGLTEGMGFDGSSIEGFARIEESDMIAKPVPTTFQLVPWSGDERPVDRMFCDILNPDGSPYEGDPRYVFKRLLEKVADKGTPFTWDLNWNIFIPIFPLRLAPYGSEVNWGEVPKFMVDIMMVSCIS